MLLSPTGCLFELASLFLIFSNVVLSSDVSFSSIPSCAIAPCFPYHSSSLGCTQLTKHCFCSALAPINCARYNCTGSNWYALEDWYSTQCPGDPPLVLMDPGIPLQARGCVREWIVPSKCNTSITRNCFCRLDGVETAIADCIQQSGDSTKEQATTIADDFYDDTCVYKEDVTGEQRPNANEEVVPAPDGSPNGEDKVDLALKVIGGIASFLTVAGVAWWIFFGCFCGVSSYPRNNAFVLEHYPDFVIAEKR